MKYWFEGKSEEGRGDKGIIMKRGSGQLVSVVKNEEGIQFMEECDGHFSADYSREEALELINELKEWVENP